MDPVHYEMLQELRRCTFMPGTWDKRFVRDLVGRPKETELTEKQQEWVEKMAYKYRRQIGRTWPQRIPERIYERDAAPATLRGECDFTVGAECDSPAGHDRDRSGHIQLQLAF